MPERRLGRTVRDSSSFYQIHYVILIKNFLCPEGHQNPISGSKVTAILLKGLFRGREAYVGSTTFRDDPDYWLYVLTSNLLVMGKAGRGED